MSFLSDLSRKLGFTSGADDREEELEDSDLPEDEEDEDYPEEESVRSSFRIPNPFRGRSASNTEEAEEDEEEPVQTRSSRRSNVIHDVRMESRGGQGAQEPSPYTHCERIVDVREIEECRHIIRYLLEGESVLLNLENIDPKACARVVDLLSGAAFALQGRLIKVAHLSYLLAPQNVEVIEPKGSVSDRARYR